MRGNIILFSSASLLAASSPAYAQSGPLIPADVAPAASPRTQPAEADQGNSNNAAAAAQPAEDAGIAEIVITAQKREQRLQDVPVAVTALTAETLLARGINQVTDITRAAPSLTITQQPNPASNSINLRGIGTFSFSIGVEPSVAVIVDDVALLQQAQAFSGLTDIARIEILRGPQGTLFGKAASAGVINIVSQAPSSDLTASLGTQLTTDEEYRIDGAVSGPLGNKVGARLNAFYVSREGYIDNIATGRKLGGEQSYGARLRVDIDPVETLNIALSGTYTRNKTRTVRTFRSAAANARYFGTGPTNPGLLIAPGLAGLNVGTENYRVRQNVDPLFDSKQALLTGRATLDIGFANLISISSYQDWKLGGIEDGDFTDQPVGGQAAGLISTSPYHARQFSQELRLVSTGNGPLTYLAGLYYANGKTDRGFSRSLPLRAEWQAEATTKSYAGFAQATYAITETTHFDGGVRVNREKVGAEYSNLLPPATNPCFVTCIGSHSDDQVTYKFALRQNFTRDVMVYGSFATGYKGFAYDIATGFTPAKAANPIRPEKSKAYEIGVKSALFDRRVTFNAAGFLSDYRDFQAQSATLVNGVTQFNLSNVGKLRSKGVEVELSARPVPTLRIDASAAYTDAKFREFVRAQCYAGQTAALGCVGGVQNRSGARLANSPKFKYSISANLDVPLNALPFNGFIQADWTHQSAVNFDLLGSPLSDQKAYGLFNSSIGIEEGSTKAYRVSLFVNNLFDKSFANFIINAQGEQQGLASQQILPRDSRRYFGVRARARY